jgi:hypothetical protein
MNKSFITLEDFIKHVATDETTLKVLELLIKQERDTAWHEGFAQGRQYHYDDREPSHEYPC